MLVGRTEKKKLNWRRGRPVIQSYRPPGIYSQNAKRLNFLPAQSRDEGVVFLAVTRSMLGPLIVNFSIPCQARLFLFEVRKRDYSTSDFINH